MKGRHRASARFIAPTSAERLIRSLVGVAAAQVLAAPDGALDAIVITAEPDASERQVLQNVTSALMAGLGVSMDPARIRFGPIGPAPNGKHAHAPLDDGPEDVADPHDREDPDILPGPGTESRLQPAGFADDVTPRLLRSSGRAAPNAPARPGTFANVRPPVLSGTAALAALGEPAPEPVNGGLRIDSVELRRQNSLVRCRVVLAFGAERFTGITEAPDMPGATLELPARAAADALRSARVPAAPIQFDGATMADIGGRLHVVASLRIWTGHDFVPAAGAAAATRSVEEAAAAAVLQAATSRT